MRRDQQVAVGDRDGRVGQQLLLALAEPLTAAMGLVVGIVVGMRNGAARRLDLELRDRHRAVDQLPDRPGRRSRSSACRCRHPCTLATVAATRGLVRDFHRDHEPLAVGADRIDVVGDDRHPLAEAGDEVLLDVDLRAVGILLERRDDVVEHTLVADDVVDERLGGAEGGLHVPLQSRPARHVARHPGRRRHVGGVGKPQHPRGQVEPLGRLRIAARQRRGVDHRVMPAARACPR